MEQTLRNPHGEAYLTVSYLPEAHVVRNTWAGYQTLGGIVYGTETCLHIAQGHCCPYLLNDNTLVTGAWDYAIDYCVREWAPRAEAAGLSHFAHVISPDAFAARSAHAFLERLGPYFCIQVFTEICDALAWLREEQAGRDSSPTAGPAYAPVSFPPAFAPAAVPAFMPSLLLPRTQLLASHSFLNLYLHEGTYRALEAEWKGFVGSAFLRQALTDALELARRHGVSAWIADERRLGPVRPEDLSWVGAYIMPQLVGMGVTRVARLEAEDPLNQLLLKQEIRTSQERLAFEVRSFADLADARAWACA